MKGVTNWDVIILGAGASGLMCAIEAGKRGRRVLVLDHADKPGNKIRISGGGRCNFTNLYTTPDNFYSSNRHFCTSALKRFTPADFISLLETHGIAFHEETGGRMFCDGSARDILNMLLSECRDANVTIRTGCVIHGITGNVPFRLSTSLGQFTAASLVVATGGLSFPNLGASPLGYKIAEQFGLKIIPPRPGLVPFALNRLDLDKFKDLAGVSIDAVVSCAGNSFRGNILFTHHGLSGPAILQISSCWKEGQEIEINLLPDLDPAAYLKHKKLARPKAELKTIMSELLPRRIAERACELWTQNRGMGNIPDRELDNLARLLTRWTIKPNGTEGYRTAEITTGGVDTAGLSSKSMEAGETKGLYFTGEVVDVTGQLGGYNLQWAWSSGFCAGQFA